MFLVVEAQLPMQQLNGRLVFALAATLLILTATLPAEPPGFTPVAKASDEAQKALKRFRMPAGVEAKVWAAEPMLAHPVCFSFDEKGPCFVAETFRLHQGVTDNRNHMDWLADPIACRTLAHPAPMYCKKAKEK